MAESILTHMTEKYNNMTRSEKKLSDYIFAHAKETQFMNITTLAEICGVSEATITRFCKTLDLGGYNDLKLALAHAQKINSYGESIEEPEVITESDSLYTMGKKLRDSYVFALNDTLQQLDEDSFDRAIDILSASSKVYCFGQGGSMVMAKEAYARFATVTSKFVHIEDSHLQIMATSMAEPSDCILFFSYSGSTRDMKDLLELASQKKVPVILVTHFRNSLASRYADVVLICGYNESPLQSGSIVAKIGQIFLIDCLYYRYCHRNPLLTSENRSLAAKAISNKLL